MADRPVIFVVAGEASGDQHAAMLGEALLRRRQVRLVGVGQQRMRQAGFELLFDSTQWSAIGLAQAARSIPALLLRGRQVARWLSRHPADLVVLVDFGAFNVRLAQVIKRGPSPGVLYYFPPRSWSRSARGYEPLARVVDRVATPFPWSADILRAAGIDATWVGHPVVDRIQPLEGEARTRLRDRLGLRPGGPIIGILPGSRLAEVTANGPSALRAASLIRDRLPGAQFMVSVAPGIPPRLLERQVRRARLRGARLISGLRDIVRAADLVITSSGTATLEAAAAACPMVVMYRAGALIRLECRLRHPELAHISLPNIIADRTIVPELVAREATGPALAEAALGLLRDPARLQETRRHLLKVRGALGPPGVSARVADIALAMMS
jgi:lipid-A-disaccharide synthase